MIRVFFDFSCPYCYLAHGYIKRINETNELNVEWASWEIHPEVPQSGLPIQDVLQNVDMNERKKKLDTLGAPVGLTPSEKTFVPNTRWALCATEFAKENGKMQEWVDAVFAASFAGKRNIGDMYVLTGIAQEIGLDSASLRAALESGRYMSTLLANDRECVEKNIEWVPTIFSGEVKLIEGAFSFEEFGKAMSRFLGN
jgi:predicted DsbA family dithiol-disulfide isomerase